MRLLAPAKLNLHLRVARPGADGFHPLLTWMCTIGLFDTLTIHQTGKDAGSVQLTCDDPSLPCDETNLVVRAANAFREGMRGPVTTSTDSTHDFVGGRPLEGRAGEVTVALGKRIPAGAGLGGGSSDAARILMGLNRLYQAGWDRDRLSQLGAKLGSDVPFFLHGPCSICTGRGENVQPIARPHVRHVLLILPQISMPTPAVYRRFDVMNLGADRDVVETDQPSWRTWVTLDAGALLPFLVNDLEPAAFSIRPDLGDLREAIETSLARPVRMSGSGSSLFTLYDDVSEAAAAQRIVEEKHRTRAMAVELAPNFVDDLNASWAGE